MFRIGPYTFKNDLILAPMAGVSELPFRRIALELGAGFAPTELVSCEGLVRLSARTMKYLRYDPRVERPFCVQIFGGDAERMAGAAQIAKDRGAEIIDINMGCPVPKVTKNGAGSALMCDPPRAGDIVAAIKAKTGLPVTVKIRSGWDSKNINAPALVETFEAAGAAAVAIHGRTRAQGYSGKADWSIIARAKAASKGMPVIGNGDVKTRADYERIKRETGCDAVMIGRGALGNPWVFRQVLGGPAPTNQERVEMVLRHFDEHLAFVGDALAGVRSFRRMLLWYAHGLRGAATFRQVASVIDDPVKVREAIRTFFGDAQQDQSGGGDDGIDYRAAYG